MLNHQEISTTSRQSRDTQKQVVDGEKVTKSICIRCDIETLYGCWRNLENLPTIMQHLQSVDVQPSGLSHWVAKSVGDMTMEWDAQIIEERENELIAWRSVDGSEVINEGSVQFRPVSEERGVEIKVSIRYNPPGGKFAVTLAKLFGKDAGTEIEGDLRRFKQLMETGEIATIAGQSSGRDTLDN